MKVLGINVDHIATLRNARNEGYPNLLDLTQVAIENGADQITAHLREDRRHIKDKDIFELSKNISVPLNMEMALTNEMVEIALKVKPYIICLVPEKRSEITTEGGLNLLANLDNLKKYLPIFKDNGIKVSLFVDPHLNQLKIAQDLNVDSVELNTGTYAQHYKQNNMELGKIQVAVNFLSQTNLAIHCGHGLNFSNITPLIKIDEIIEYNIGHFLVSYALHVGFAKSVKQMKNIITGVNDINAN